MRHTKRQKGATKRLEIEREFVRRQKLKERITAELIAEAVDCSSRYAQIVIADIKAQIRLSGVLPQ